MELSGRDMAVIFLTLFGMLDSTRMARPPLLCPPEVFGGVDSLVVPGRAGKSSEVMVKAERSVIKNYAG